MFLREGVKNPTADLFCSHFELKCLELFKRKTFFFSSIFVTLSFNKSFFPKNKFDNSDLWLYVPNKTDRDNSQATCNAKTSPGGGDGLNSITKSACASWCRKIVYKLQFEQWSCHQINIVVSRYCIFKDQSYMPCHHLPPLLSLDQPEGDKGTGNLQIRLIFL